MPDEAPVENTNRVLVARIVSAYLRRNEISADQVPVLISTVYDALGGPGKPTNRTGGAHASRTDPKIGYAEFRRLLECGRQGKMLRRHLGAAHGLTSPPIAPSGICRPSIRWSHRATRHSGRSWLRSWPRSRSAVSDQGSESTASPLASEAHRESEEDREHHRRPNRNEFHGSRR